MSTAPRTVTADQRHRHADAVVAAGPLDLKRRRDIVARYPEGTWMVLLSDGCDVAVQCRRCPLRRCRFDDEKAFVQLKTLAKYHVIAAVLEGNRENYDLTARQLQISNETVHRARRVVKQGTGLAPADLEALTPLVVTDGPTTHSKVHLPRQLSLL